MKEFLKRSVLQIGSVGLTCLSLRVAGLILGREWCKGRRSHSLNFLKIHLSDFCKQLIMETGEDVYLRL